MTDVVDAYLDVEGDATASVAPALDQIPFFAFAVHENEQGLTDLVRPSQLKREWMEQTPDRFAYRCLPLNIANMLGWDLINPVGFEAVWNGGAGKDSIIVRPQYRADANHTRLPLSHFGSGVLTFSLPLLFRTPPGIQLLVTGPLNSPKDGISPLSGVVETDSLAGTFTMNWKFTTPNEPVRFAAGEPMGTIIPVMLDMIESMSPTVLGMDKEPGLRERFTTWSQSRSEFNVKLAARDPEATRQKWQRDYFQGKHAGGEGFEHEHRTKMNLRAFIDERKKPVPFVGLARPDASS